MSNENNKFRTSEVEVAMVALVGTLPPVKIQSSVDAAQVHTHVRRYRSSSLCICDNVRTSTAFKSQRNM